MTTLHLRIHDAVQSLRSARDTGDQAQIEAQAGEIEDLVEIAARHGVDIASGYQGITSAA